MKIYLVVELLKSNPAFYKVISLHSSKDKAYEDLVDTRNKHLLEHLRLYPEQKYKDQEKFTIIEEFIDLELVK